MKTVKFSFINAGLEHWWIKKLSSFNEETIQNYLEHKNLPFDLSWEDVKYKIC